MNDGLRWFPGFFTGRRHAVPPRPVLPWRFRAQPIVWALCGAPALAVAQPARREFCAECVARAKNENTTGARR